MHECFVSLGWCVGGWGHPLHPAMWLSALFQSDKQPGGAFRPDTLRPVRIQFSRLGRHLLSRQGAYLLVASCRSPAEILSQRDTSASLDSSPGKWGARWWFADYRIKFKGLAIFRNARLVVTAWNHLPGIFDLACRFGMNFIFIHLILSNFMWRKFKNKVSRRSILGSDGMTKSNWSSLALWVLFKWSLSAF